MALMRTFDDFEAWNDAILGAELRTVCPRAETHRWGIGAVSLGAVAVQIAEEGGGNLAYGRSVHAGPILFLPLTRVGDHVANGERLDAGSLLVIPPGSDFRISVVRRAHSWCSIALPPAGPGPAAWMSSGRIAPGAASVRALKRLAVGAYGALGAFPRESPAHAAAGIELSAAAAACMPGGVSGAVLGGRPRIDRAGIIRRMMELIECSHEVVVSPAAVAAAVGIHERTLQRAVHETFGTGTKHYLLLRALHSMRRRLSKPADGSTGVTEILAGMGIWEFGRFAGRYRRHFGELPSETLRRARG
jgi:AraC family ethanolamine operon transcriptional activator